jgi:PKD repeat protein
MTAIRPMPPTIPYFKYTFNNTTVSFTSVETADSYAWTFGDGTTSTVKNPVKTYASKGTYTVSLAVTNGGVVTRTTTEPVIVESLAAYPVRYIKFAQKLHTGTHAFDTPTITGLTPLFGKNTYVQTTPQASFTLDPRSIAKAQTYSMDYTQGTSGTPVVDPISPTGNSNKRPYSNFTRVKSLDGTFRTQWELVGDLGTTPINNIYGFSVILTNWPADGAPATAATGISYEVYVTDYSGAPAGIAGATWTKIGDFNPTAIPTTSEKQYFMTPL